MEQNNKDQGQNNRGKGWFGDPQGHANAGRKGGKARARNRSNNNNNS